MQAVDAAVKRAATRLGSARFLGALAVALTVGGGAVVLARVGERVLPWTAPWGTVWAAAVGASVVAAAAWAWVTRPSRLDVARLVDDRAGLREALSTAVWTGDASDGWSDAARAHAERVARGVDVGRALPIGAWAKPRVWPWPAALAVLFLLLGLSPRVDLLHRAEAAKPEKMAQAETVRAEAEVKEMTDRLNAALAKVGEDALPGPDSAAPESRSPEDVARVAVKRLTEAQDRLDQLAQAQSAQAAEELQRKMETLKRPGPGPLDAMARAMQQGDFAGAAAALAEVQKQVESGAMTPEAAEQMKKQLESLAQELSRLAEDRKELEKKLAEMGLEKSLAADTEALKKALEASKDLTPEQKQGLMNQASSLAKAGGACKNAAAAAASKNLAALGDSLSAAEMMKSELGALKAAQGEIKDQLARLGSGMCRNPGSNGLNLQAFSKKSGGNGRNQGFGSGAEESREAPFSTTEKKAIGKQQDGPIIGTMLVQGDQVRGESRQQFGTAVKAASERASEAIETKQIPREYHEAVKRYFGGLEKKAAAPSGDAKPAAPANGG